jgi:hypothetical protein
MTSWKTTKARQEEAKTADVTEAKPWVMVIRNIPVWVKKQEFKEMKPDTQEISWPNVCSLQLNVCCCLPWF